MIFVTVGTHEQQFNRLLQAVDEMCLNEDVFIQTGYSTYTPKHCRCKKMISADEMSQYVKDARIVITHGGPGSIFLPLQMGKVPIVVPRQHQFGEHVNDHQVAFCEYLSKQRKIVQVLHIDELKQEIDRYDDLAKEMAGIAGSHTKQFVSNFEEEVNKIMIR